MLVMRRQDYLFLVVELNLRRKHVHWKLDYVGFWLYEGDLLLLPYVFRSPYSHALEVRQILLPQ
ncbi:unnamed protein product [Schistosoma mattheei]|uniref:Uncharacterized protein n=1 Tax=Schistosoma mattheei TaxID=31246 RepID=A0A3P8CFX5_9TREM|nr:unnamed protein product [Schistosoma mattheei]